MITRQFIVRVAITLLLCIQGVAHAQFMHPGALHSATELNFLRSSWQADNAQSVKSPQWIDFNSVAETALGAPLPQPVTDFFCGRVFQGQSRDPACNSMRSDGQRAYTLALKWFFTGDDRYGLRSLEIIRLWQNTFCGIRGDLVRSGENDGNCRGGTYNDDRGQSGLEASWISPHFVNAAEILRHADPDRSLWTAADTRQFNIFLTRMLNEMNEEAAGASYNNAVWTEIEAIMAIAIFQDNQEVFDDAVSLWHDRIKTSIYMKEDGLQPNHVPRRAGRALVHDWNFPIGFDSGQMQDGFQAETCRDINHTDMGFKGQTYSAHMAFNQGIDLFGEYQGRFRAFMEFHNALRNGVIGTEVCKDASMFFNVNNILSNAENRTSGAFSEKIKNTRARLKWNRPDISVQSGDPAQLQIALSNLGGIQNQGAWLNLLTQTNNANNFDTHLRNIETVANVKYWREWPKRRPKCYSSNNGPLAYPCGRNGNDIDLWHLAYNHLSQRLGLDLPMSRTTIDNYAANGLLVPSQQFIGQSKWESLGGIGTGMFGTSAKVRPPSNDDSYTNVLFSDDTDTNEYASFASNVTGVSVIGNTISWPDDGWYQVQRQSDYVEVCADGRSCVVPGGIYVVINHTTGQRFENVEVNPAGGNSFTYNSNSNERSSNSVRVNGNVISWPDDGWYQVQRRSDFFEMCSDGRSCEVPNGTYIIINHTTGQRFEDVLVE